jgi:hypothetical protein
MTPYLLAFRRHRAHLIRAYWAALSLSERKRCVRDRTDRREIDWINTFLTAPPKGLRG